MQLKDLVVDIKEAWVEYPGMDGFEVKLANLSRPALSNLRKKCLSSKFDKKTHQAVESLDEEKFVKEFTKATVKDWKGFKLKYLEDFLLVDLSEVDPESELEYSPDSALTLIKGSTDFDTWVNETVFDLDNFRSGSKGGDVEEA